jgi:hypothetical protein
VDLGPKSSDLVIVVPRRPTQRSMLPLGRGPSSVETGRGCRGAERGGGGGGIKGRPPMVGTNGGVGRVVLGEERRGRGCGGRAPTVGEGVVEARCWEWTGDPAVSAPRPSTRCLLVRRQRVMRGRAKERRRRVVCKCSAGKG